ncbi:MAG: hypothetical protein IPG46_20185 [Actinobacteria bacterium]|nr:hypothetical protein [Actinomycetota bacterium]
MEGMVCFARGDSVAASESFTSALASRYRPFGTTGIAESFLALASADLGVDLTAAPEERFRLSFEVDGNIMGGLSADWMLAIHHLLTDDIEAARCAMRRSLDRSMATGMAGTGPNERYALVAAGIDDFDDVITADGTHHHIVEPAGPGRATPPTGRYRRGAVAGPPGTRRGERRGCTPQHGLHPRVHLADPGRSGPPHRGSPPPRCM